MQTIRKFLRPSKARNASMRKAMKEAHEITKKHTHCVHGRSVEVHCPACHREIIAMGEDEFS